MIKSVTSDSSYLTLQTRNNLLSKLATEKNDTSSYNNSLVSATETGDDTEEKSSPSLSLEVQLEMMKSNQSQSSSSTTSSEKGSLGSADADSDGTLSVDEFDGLMTQMGVKSSTSAEDFFAKYDTDEDGEITSTEMDASRPSGKMGPPPPMGPPPTKSSTSTETDDDSDEDSSLSSLDTDGDGVISLEEYQAANEKQLAKMVSNESTSTSSTDSTTSSEKGGLGSVDADSDGTLSVDEFENLMTQMGVKSSSSAEDFFTKYDTDEDGEITSAEMDASRPSGPPPMGPPPTKSSTSTETDDDSDEDSSLSALDTDGDGVISLEEYQAANDKQLEKMKKMLDAYQNNYDYTFGSSSSGISTTA